MATNNNSQINLKKLIKQLVKESINEILLENYVESMVKKSINENINKLERPLSAINDNKVYLTDNNISYSLKEQLSNNNFIPVSNLHNHKHPLQSVSAQPKKNPEEERKKILKKIIGENTDNNPYADILNETLNENKTFNTTGQILEETEDNDVDDVPLEYLQQSGLINKNWACINKDSGVKDISEEKKMEELREKRKEMLNKLIKR